MDLEQRENGRYADSFRAVCNAAMALRSHIRDNDRIIILCYYSAMRQSQKFWLPDEYLNHFTHILYFPVGCPLDGVLHHL